MKIFVTCVTAILAFAAVAPAQRSPAQTATATIGGKALSIKYSAPSVRGRKIFGDGGLVMKDPTAPIWRAGANAATAFHTDADLDIGGIAVPKGDYTLFIGVKDENAWEFIVNKETGQWGLAYKTAQDLGRVKMQMSKPSALVETLKWSIIDAGGNKGKLQLEWENHVASVPVTVK